MINEQKERNTLTKMSDLEYSKNDVEMMRYRDNKAAYWFGIGGMAFSMLACFIGLNSMTGATFNTMIVIMINIAVLLGGFLACERTKSYSKGGCIALIIYGGVSFARMFYVPLIILINYTTYSNYLAGSPDVTAEQYESAVYYLGPTITAHDGINNVSANAFLWSNGYFRGITAMILLAASAALFIVAGVIGFMRSQKLTKYLDSINQKK